MAPTPITATHRLRFVYDVGTFRHHQNNYCNAVASADPTGFSLQGRGAFTLVGLSTIPDIFFAAIAPFYDPASATFVGWVLEQHVSGAYVFVTSGVTTVVPTAGPFNEISMGLDVAGKDAANRTIHAYLYEGNLGLPNKIVSYAAASAGEKALIDFYFAQGRAALSTDAFTWGRAKGNALRNRWLSLVFDTNQKLRRLRRIS